MFACICAATRLSSSAEEEAQQCEVKTNHKFVNTTPNPSATKNSNGLCVTPPPAVGVGDGIGIVGAGSDGVTVVDGRAEET